ncbi:MAG: cupin domain-containing protein [Anaerolineae bacterium]
MESTYAYVANLAGKIGEIPADSIVSRTIHSSAAAKTILFGFAAGQELSEHTAAKAATLTFLQGEADLTLGSDSFSAQAGTWVEMPPHLPHSIRAKTPVLMLLTLHTAAEG